MEQPHQNGGSPKFSYDVVEDYCNSSNKEDMLEFVNKNQEDHSLSERHEHLEWQNDENDEDYECNYTNRALRFSMVIEKEATKGFAGGELEWTEILALHFGSMKQGDD
ncbi:hypothetical protein IFM89_029488 [Coptis chinensis]|uniref:Uncharacterized protein n=1 Tax=Coptis chinensis TaxID=261450 RepID=A0A835HY08_9MAGN|nr:hypothetical protein IFM89_029488 [Coptis chinensis]